MMRRMLLCAVMACFALVSCEKVGEGNTDDDSNKNDDQVTVFTANLVSVGKEDLVINVNKGLYEGNFYVACVEASLVDCDSEEFAKECISHEQESNTNLAKADEIYIFSKGGTIHIGENWMLYSGTEYRVAIFGIAPDGSITTDIIDFTASTKAIKKVGTVECTVNEATTENVLLDFAPSAGVGNYVYYMMPTYIYKYQYKEDTRYLANKIVYTLNFYGFDLTEVDGKAVLNGAQTAIDATELWGSIIPDMDHTILAFGIDEDGCVNTDVTVVETMAGPEDVSVEGSVSLSLIDDNIASVSVSTTVEGEVGNYFICPCRVSLFEDFFENDYELAFSSLICADIIEHETDYSKASKKGSIFNGAQSEIKLREIWNLSNTNDYIILVAGINENGRPTTAVNHVDVSAQQAASIMQSESLSLKNVCKPTAAARLMGRRVVFEM